MTALLIPGGPPKGWNDPSEEEIAERAKFDAEIARINKELAEFRRKYPKLAAREDARMKREEAEIRRRVFREHGMEP
jgi:hypothetical protein